MRAVAHSSAEIDALLARAVGRHGGAERWQRLDRITVEVAHMGGLVPWFKGLGHTFPCPAAVHVWPHRRRVEFVDYPRAGRRGLYDRGRVTVDEALPDAPHRSTFRGIRKLRRWSPLDALYFFGAALTTYLSVPFVLGECEVLALRRPGSGSTSALTVRFPDDRHTHGPVQRFWFDAEGLLVRHDYHAEVIGPGAYGAHFTRDYAESQGLPVARTREVFAAIGPYPRVAATPLPILQARLDPVEVRFGRPPP